VWDAAVDQKTLSLKGETEGLRTVNEQGGIVAVNFERTGITDSALANLSELPAPGIRSQAKGF